jgi:hypothetical protein
MKPLKFLMIAILSMCFISSANAQTSKRKKSKVKTTTAAVKYQCPMKCEGDKTYAKASKCPVCNMALSKVQKETAAYKCPMKCEGDKTYTKAGKCAVCNMNLAKVEAKKATTGHEGHNHN